LKKSLLTPITRWGKVRFYPGGTCVDYGIDGHSCGFGPDCGETATCSGNTSQLCVFDAQISIDCVASGYAGCNLGSCVTATLPP
jgi:hypothetical protein